MFVSCSVVPISLWPHVLRPPGFFVHGIFPGKDAGVGCHFLLQGLFPTQGSNPCLLHWQVNSLPLSHRGSPCVLSHTCIYAHSCVLFVYSLCVSLSYRQCLRYTDGFESLTTDFPSRLFGYNFHNFNMLQFSSVQLLSCVRLFATPWIAARQAPLSITNSWSSLRLTSIESVMPSSHLILCPAPNPSQHQSLFQWVNSLHEVAKVLEFQL